MPVFGEYETIGEPVSITETHGHLSTIWRVRKSGSQDRQIYALKCFSPRRREVPAQETEDTLEADRSLEFLEAVKQVKKAQSEGGRCLVPIHAFGPSDEGAWYVTDFFSRGSLKNWIEKKGRVDDAALRRIVHSIAAGCLALKRHCGRSHGNLKAANVFLSGRPRPLRKTPFLIADPIPMPLTHRLGSGDRRTVGGLIHDVFEVHDLRAIGELILQLVEGRLIGSGYDYNFPIVQSAAWSNLGKHGESWRELCNRLLDPNLSTEKVNLESLERKFRPSAVVSSLPVLFAVGAVICAVAGLTYWWFRQPRIVTQLADVTSQVGSDATFTIHATGWELAYQWRSNGVVIPDATGARYRIRNVQTNQTGSIFRIMITNSVGSVTSRIAKLTVNRRPQTITFASLPDKSVNDKSFNLEARASSELHVRYQSSKTNVATVSENENTVTILNAGTTTITASQPGDAMYLPAKPVGQPLIVSRAEVAPQITQVPEGQKNAMAGSNVVFTVKASGTPPLSYRWRKDNRELQDGGNVSGATTNVLTLNNVGTNDTGDYEVVIRNTAGATNARARLTVNRRSQAIDFKKLPDKRVGDPPFALGATADSRLSVVYQSSKPEVATVSSNTVTILNAGTTTITASQPGDGMYLPAKTVNQPLIVSRPEVVPQITQRPASQTVTAGSNATFIVVASGTTPLSYQWRKSNQDLSNGGNISGVTTSILTVNNVSVNDTGNYEVVISNAAGRTNATAQLMVNPSGVVPSAPQITQVPEGQNVMAGSECGVYGCGVYG